MKSDRHAVVPAAEVRTYYDHPVIRGPVWTWEIPWYFFAGGTAGAAAPLALAARLTDRTELAQALEIAAALGAAVSPILLVADLGRPSRFYNMLRVFKPSSPMSVGSWVLAVFAPAAIGAAALDQLSWLGRLSALRPVAGAVAAVTGPVIATYTAVLFADTAVPVWHAAHRELPAVFGGSALASAGAAGVIGVAPALAGPARRALLIGAAVELGAVTTMERTLGPLAAPYAQGRARRFARAARTLTALGAALVLTGGRTRRWAAVTGGAAVMAGSACERWAVFTAGRQSAADPGATTGPQRARLAG